MYSKKSEKRKKKKKPKKPKKPKRIARERRPAGLPGMFPSPIMGSNSVVYQPAPMPREDPVAQINIRNTEAVRNRLLLEQVTDLVAPQRRAETLAVANNPNVESSTPRETLDKQTRSSSAPAVGRTPRLRLGKAGDRTPIAGVGTKQKISEVKTGLGSVKEEQQRIRRTNAEIAAGMTHAEKVAQVASSVKGSSRLAERVAQQRGRPLTREGK